MCHGWWENCDGMIGVLDVAVARQLPLARLLEIMEG